MLVAVELIVVTDARYYCPSSGCWVQRGRKRAVVDPKMDENDRCIAVATSKFVKMDRNNDLLLDRQEIKHLNQEQFMKLDKNNDLVISPEEFAHCLDKTMVSSYPYQWMETGRRVKRDRVKRCDDCDDPVEYIIEYPEYPAPAPVVIEVIEVEYN